MSRKINQSDESLQDVIKAADYIAGHYGLNASDKFLTATKRTFAQLAEMPGMGAPRDYGNPTYEGMRMWSVSDFRRYLIFYRVKADELEILRVLHGAQDIEQIFAPQDPGE